MGDPNTGQVTAAREVLALTNLSLPAMFLDILSWHSAPVLVFCLHPRKDVLAGSKLETELHSMPVNSNGEQILKQNSYY